MRPRSRGRQAYSYYSRLRHPQYGFLTGKRDALRSCSLLGVFGRGAVCGQQLEGVGVSRGGRRGRAPDVAVHLRVLVTRIRGLVAAACWRSRCPCRLSARGRPILLAFCTRAPSLLGGLAGRPVPPGFTILRLLLCLERSYVAYVEVQPA